MMPLSKQEEFFVPEFSEEQISIATTEFSTHAPSEANKSYLNGMDETGSVSGMGSFHDDGKHNIDSFNGVRNTPDKRIKEDFEGEDQSYHESESEDVTTEEDEEPDSIFVKPTKPAPRKKIVSKTISEINSESQKINELNQL